MARFAAEHPTGVAVEQLESLVRVAVFRPANALVGFLLQQAADRIDASYQPKPGQHYKGREKLGVQGMFGEFVMERAYYYDPEKKQGHYPADAALGLEVGYTPALARVACMEGVDESSFEKAQEHLKETGGIEISARQIHRIVQRVGPAAEQWQERQAPPQSCDAPVMYVSPDGTGVPMRKEELVGRKGKQADGTAKTRLAYLGCVFTQHTRDKDGHPIRDHESTTYVSSFERAEDFGLILRKEALRRGSGTAKKIIVLLDGAESLENLGRINFPGSLQIVDFYHAMEHLDQLLEALWGKGHPDFKKQYRRWAKWLLKNNVQRIIDQARQWSAGLACEEAVEKALNYFVHNVDRMQYGTFRQLGYFIGSGVIEAGCKTVIGSRCKQSGMLWSEPGAQNIIALRCVKSSREWKNFWRSRANEHSARNDSLPLAA
jgi:hypothetical protein